MDRTKLVSVAAALSLASVILVACQTSAAIAQDSQTVKPAAATFDSSLSWKFLLKQLEFGTRNPGSKGHLACRDWLVDEMKKHTENVRLQPLTHKWSRNGQTVEMWNVLGEQNWKDAKTRVVLLAHWDTRPTADMESDPQKASQPILGANDGASGVAVLLELMRVMKGQVPKDLGILYLMTDGEDLGPGLNEMFLGARAFAKSPGTPRPDYGILLDMIGDKDLVIPIEPQSRGFAPKLVDAFYAFARKIGMEKTFPSQYGPYIEDDHIPLNQAGIPTMDLIDFDYEPWHTAGDTADKCSAESLGKVGATLQKWLLQNPVWSMQRRP